MIIWRMYCRSKVVTHRWLLGDSLRYKLSVHKLIVTDTNVGEGGEDAVDSETRHPYIYDRILPVTRFDQIPHKQSYTQHLWDSQVKEQINDYQTIYSQCELLLLIIICSFMILWKFLCQLYVNFTYNWHKNFHNIILLL